MIYNIDNKNVLAFSTERGFVDKDMPYDGFNITYYTDDDAEHIAQCRYDLRQMLEVADDHLILPRQVHDTRIAEVTAQNLGDKFEGIDALITTLPRTCIGVSTADCVPILIYNTRTRDSSSSCWMARYCAAHQSEDYPGYGGKLRIEPGGYEGGDRPKHWSRCFRGGRRGV